MSNQDYLDQFTFTERAKKVLSLAEKEAQRFNHNYIGTEHLLLGLVRDEEGVAAQVLRNLGVELNKVRSAVEFIIGRGDRIVLGEIGLTPRGKKVIELARDEARRLNQDFIDSEHLLLGLVREGEGIAAGVLESLGVNLEKVRTETIRVLVEASSLYIPRPRLLSSKEAGALSNIETLSLVEAMIALEAVLHEKETAIQHHQYKPAMNLRRREVALREHIDRLVDDWQREQASRQTTENKASNADLAAALVLPVATRQAIEGVAAPAAVAPARSGAFISYSHKDKEYLERLRVHLHAYERAGALNVWDDTKIAVGARWREEIRRALKAARVAILLISADFLASDFIAGNELPPLLAAAQDEGAVIIPVILKHCAFEESELGQFQAVEHAQPLIDLPEGRREEVWAKVARLVREALKMAEVHTKGSDSV